MLTQAVLTKPLEHKLLSFKLWAFIASSLFLTACLGNSNVPVTYVIPAEGETYTAADFLPHIEFPDGVPPQDEVVITLNGVEIQSYFDEWSGTTARITGPVAALEYNAARRNGRNLFQVLEPNKDLIEFTLELGEIDIRIVEVDDQWSGVGDKGVNDTVTVRGYLPEDLNVVTMNVLARRINDSTGALEAISANPANKGESLSVAPGGSVSEFDGVNTYSLELYGPGHTTTDVRDLSDVPNGFAFTLSDSEDTDAIVIAISARDSNNVLYHHEESWLRPDEASWISEIGGNGAISLAINQVTLSSIEGFIEDRLSELGDIDLAATDECDNGGLGSLLIDLQQAIVTDSDIKLRINDSTSSHSPTTSRMSLDIDLDLDLQGRVALCLLVPGSIQYSADLKITTDTDGKAVVDLENPDLNGVANILQGIGCNLIGGIASGGLFTNIINNAILRAVNGIIQNDVPRAQLVIRIGEEISPPVPTECHPSNCPEIDTETGCIPAEPYDPGEYLFGAFILKFAPKLDKFFNLSYPFARANIDSLWGVNLGLHPSGAGVNRVPSIGSPYNPNALKDARLESGSAASLRTTGVSISELALNQIFMGLWEASILYLDLEIPEIQGSVTPLLDDVKVLFASSSPWTIDLIPSTDVEGDLRVMISDLRLEIVSDITNPFGADLDDFTIGSAIVDVELPLNVGANSATGSLQLSMPTPGLNVTVRNLFSSIQTQSQGFNITLIGSDSSALIDFSSDNTTPVGETLMGIIDVALNNAASMFEVEIPIPDILGFDLDFGKISSDGNQLNILVDLYDSNLFPNPRNPSF